MKLVQDSKGVKLLSGDGRKRIYKGFIASYYIEGDSIVLTMSIGDSQNNDEDFRISISDITHIDDVPFTGSVSDLETFLDSNLFKTGGGDGEGSLVPLDFLTDNLVNPTYLPSYVDDVIEVADYASLPTTGESGKIYITLDNNSQYRWSGSVYVSLTQPVWKLGGNVGTNPATDFIGTTDAQPLIVRTNNVEAGRILTTQQVVFGAATAPNLFYNPKVSVFATTITQALYLKGGGGGVATLELDTDSNQAGLTIKQGGTVYGKFLTQGSLFLDNILTTNPFYIRSAQDIVFRAGGLGTSNLMTLKASGNVLIGTTTDAGYKLDINGVLRVGSVGIVASPNTTSIFIGAMPNVSYVATSNTIIGVSAGTSLTTAGMRNNVMIGDYAGQNAAGDCVFNTFIGSAAGRYTTGRNNTFIGYSVGVANTSGYQNTAIGCGALAASITGIGNTAIGHEALKFNTAHYNTAMGQSAGAASTTGIDNTFVGLLSGSGNTTGSENTYLGSRASQVGNATGSGNTIIGCYAGAVANTSFNTYIGNRAGTGVSGNNNIAIGYRAMVTAGHTGAGNVLIGNNMDLPSLTESNQTNINNTFLASASQAWIGGGRTFMLGMLSDDPDAIDGSLYYNKSNGKFRGCENGHWFDLI